MYEYREDEFKLLNCQFSFSTLDTDSLVKIRTPFIVSLAMHEFECDRICTVEKRTRRY